MSHQIMPVAVIVSTWTGADPAHLRALIESIDRRPAGTDFGLYLSANGEDYRLPAGVETRFAGVFVRENRGFNLAAWDHAWRELSGFDRFLFVQDDCLARRANWLRDFDRCFNATARCGLVGEHLNRWWDQPWDRLESLPDSQGPVLVDGVPMSRARCYRRTLARWGVPEGRTARHLTSVVHFTTRAVLAEVGGYRRAETYHEAVAAEIAFSRSVEACGYTLAQIGRQRHSRIAHRDWPGGGMLDRLRRRLVPSTQRGR